MKVDSQWRNTIQKHVDPQIILQIIYKMWSVNILLNDVAYLSLGSFLTIALLLLYEISDLINVASQKYSFALAHRVWLHNIGHFVLLTVVLIVSEMVP